MGKLLLLVAALFVGVAALRVFASVRKKQVQAAQAEPQAHTQAHTQVQPASKPAALLPCPQCGVHMPQAELAQHQLSLHR